jgi:hypothetical protein
MDSIALPRFRAGKRLDTELAEGADPRSVPERDRRARWLTRKPHRERLAAGFERLVSDAPHPTRCHLPAAAPFRADAVREASAELLALAATLRATRRPSVSGVARARRLLTDPAGPLYGDTGADLREITDDIRRAIEDGHD